MKTNSISKIGVGYLLFLLGLMPNLYCQSFTINEIGTNLYSIENESKPGFVLSGLSDSLSFVKIDTLHAGAKWRKTNLEHGYVFLDFDSSINLFPRLMATSYLGARLTKNGIEGKNDDAKWQFAPLEGKEGYYLKNKTSGKFLSYINEEFVMVEKPGLGNGSIWKLTLEKIDLESISSPILMMGNDNVGFRDPTLIYKDGIFYMYYSLVLTEEDEKIYWYVAYSKSEDLVSWSDPVTITQKNQNKNFGSPGNIVRFNDEWVLCMQTYVMPNFTRKNELRMGNADCRIWITRSKDLENWSEPEKLWVMGDQVDPGRLIDAYLLEDKDESGKWWCFYKRNGASYSYSYDLKNWVYEGNVASGENVCVLVLDDAYYMMHSPEIGMGVLKTKDFEKWDVVSDEITLGQEDWGHWAGQRVTAGFVLDLRSDPKVGKYLMFFHGQGPAPKSTEIIDSGTDLGIAWSDDLINWQWPGKQ